MSFKNMMRMKEMTYIQKMEQSTFAKDLPTRKRQETGKHAALFSVFVSETLTR